MTYSYFKKELCKMVQAKMGDGYTVEVITSSQNNSRGREAVCIHTC